MSFKRETILWLRDVRQFVLHLPRNKSERTARLLIVGMFFGSITAVLVALFQRG